MIRKLLFLGLYLLPFFLSAQNVLKTIDSLMVVTQRKQADTTLINNYFLLAKEYQKTDVDKSVVITQKILKLAKKANYPKGMAHYYILTAGNEIVVGNYDVIKKIKTAILIYKNYKKDAYYFQANILLAKNYYNNYECKESFKLVKYCLKEILNSGLNKEIGELYYCLAINEDYLNHIKEAIQALGKAKFYLEKNNCEYEILTCENIKSVIYAKTDRLNEGLSILKDASNVALKSNYKYLSMRFLTNLTGRYMEIEDYSAALYTSKKALKICNQVQNLKLISFNNSSIGIIYYRLKNYKMAIQTLRNLLKINTDQNSRLRSYQYLGKCYYELKKYKTALAYQKKIIDEFTKQNDLKDKVEYFNIYDEIAETHFALGEYKKAYQFLEISKIKNINFLNEQNNQEVSELLIKYDTNEKQMKLSKTQFALKTQKLENDTAKLYNFLLLLIVFIITLVVIFFVRINSLKRFENIKLLLVQNKLIKTLEDKEILLKEVHHRVKNNLQLIGSLFSLQTHYKKLNYAEFSFVKAMHSRIDAMALVHQNLYEGSDLEHVDTKTYLSNLISNIQKISQTDMQDIAVHQDIVSVNLPMNTAVSLGLIVNELMTNAFKYAFCNQSKGNIYIILTKVNAKLKLEVFDNGLGFDTTKTTQSLGLKLVELLSKQIQGKTWVKSKNGSKFTMIF